MSFRATGLQMVIGNGALGRQNGHKDCVGFRSFIHDVA
jgi:hypothetical protein